jgi:hypothetical protein
VRCIIAIILAAVAIVWGGGAAWWAAFPGPSGEWAALSGLAAWVGCLPLGTIAIVLALTARPAPSSLRRAATWMAAVALAMPVVVTVIWRGRMFHW